MREILIGLCWLAVIAVAIYLFATMHQPGPHDDLKPPRKGKGL